MKVSVNWIRDLNTRYRSSADPMPKGIDDLVQKIGGQLGAVEEVIDLGKRYDGVVVVKVVTCEKHSNADKLSVCLVNDGAAVKNVQRNQDGLVQVVCGAPNVKAGMLAVWIPPGVTVPATFDKDPFILEAREIRGKVSNGMLASAKELALGDNHTGILEVDEDVQSGASFATAYKLDDYIIDIENKMFTHRPDLFGQLGIARELAGIYGHSYKSPDWYKTNASVPTSNAQNSLKIEVKNEISELVPRFCILPIKDVKIGSSPIWLQSYLSRVGIRPINNVVDLTNYLMMMLAQPLHAYDYDKVKAQDPGSDHATIDVRLSKKGEKITLLGGKDIELQENSITIASATKAIGLGGVMGGADTEVDERTKNIILECGTFDMNTIRRTCMTYGLFTDAATRFTKGQSPLQNQAVIAKLATDVLSIAGGRVCGQLIDDNHLDSEILVRRTLYEPVITDAEFINERLGVNLNSDEVKYILENVEFKIETRGEKLQIMAPFWRTDIQIAEDIVEEVGRLYGFDKLPLKLPRRDLVPAQTNPMIEFKSRLREILCRSGANEVLTYSFVHGNLLDKVGQKRDLAFRLSNALSPDLQYYRLSLTPSLLDKIHSNIKLGFSEFALYEINKVHSKTELGEDDLPREFDRLALVLAVNDKIAEKNYGGAAYFGAKKQLTCLLDKLGVDVRYVPLGEIPLEKPELIQQMNAPYQPQHSAAVLLDGNIIGVVGEFKSTVTAVLKLPSYCAGFEIFLSNLQSSTTIHYKPLNRFPSLDQDITLRCDAQMSYASLTEFIDQELQMAAKEHGYRYEFWPLDIFQKQGDNDHKQTTWRITLTHPERTLTTKETNKLLDKISMSASKQLNAERI